MEGEAGLDGVKVEGMAGMDIGNATVGPGEGRRKRSGRASLTCMDDRG